MTSYSTEEIRAALGAAATVEDVAEFLNIDYPVSMHGVSFTGPKADFAGFTAEDLENYLKSELIDNESLEVYWDEMRTVLEDGGYTPWRGERVDIKPFPHGKVRVEDDEETGGEGSQESIYIVLSVTAHVVEDGIGAERKRYFRKQGYYASYDGSNWDGDFHEVWPKQKEITVWVSKKP